jgi:Kinesin motor domain
MREKIDIARLKRSTARTDANEVSSRSHAIFHITVVTTIVSEKRKPKTLTGTITIVDLAGSERLSQSKTEGDRLNETKAINKSLTSLRDVISALYKKEQHVPYRNSKLTTILQDCLGKDSKTLVIINVSPCVSHIAQTLGSLKFGNQLKQCSIGVPAAKIRPALQPMISNIARQESNSKSSFFSSSKPHQAYNRFNSGLKPANPMSFVYIKKDLKSTAQKQATANQAKIQQPSLMQTPKFDDND